MATPKPGEIRCPTCHRSTPPATFCTQCGSAIPPDARARPRGMDRDELQDRIRARRSGGDPYRRGGVADSERGGYERFEPDPTDAQARREGGTGPAVHHDFLAASETADEPEDRNVVAPVPSPAATTGPFGTGDVTRDRDEWARPAAAPTFAAAPPPDPGAPPPSDLPVGEPEFELGAAPPVPDSVRAAWQDAIGPEYVDDDGEADYDHGYLAEDWEERRERRSGAGALAILGFLALGVLALVGGAVLAGLFDGDGGSGVADATASPSAAVVTAEPSPSPTPLPTESEAASPGASGEPVVFPDGFTAEAQPCIRGSASSPAGCSSNGAGNNGSVDVWVGFENGNANDVVGATLVAPDGSTVDGSIDLADIGCSSSCNGYTWFPFDGLAPGTYEVRVTRNGDLAGVTSFEVS